MRNFLAFLALLLCASVHGQSIQQPSVRLDGDDIIISFDLTPRESVQELFDITITSSLDNYAKPLNIKTGKVKEARPANALQYVISGPDNFRDYEGDLAFEIKAKMVYSPIRILNPDKGKNVAKGKGIEVSWRGGLDNEKYNLELYEGDQKVRELARNITSESYYWNVPKAAETGNFKLKLLSDVNPRQTAFSSEFMIKKKFPILLVIAPIAVVGGVLATMGGGDEGTTLPPDDSLPLPPDLPDN